MTVEKAIEILQKQNPKAKLILKSDNFELNGAYVDLEIINPDKATEKKEQFRDAFDGGKYSTKVWSFSNGDTDVIVLRG